MAINGTLDTWEPGVVRRGTSEYRVVTTTPGAAGGETLIDWSDFEIPALALAQLNGDASPVEAFDQGAIGDNNAADAAAALAAFPAFPGNVWTTALVGVTWERTATGAQADVEPYVTSAADPNFVQSDGTFGGRGLPQGGNPASSVWFPRGFWGVGVHRVRIADSVTFDGSTPGTPNGNNILGTYDLEALNGAGYRNIAPLIIA